MAVLKETSWLYVKDSVVSIAEPRRCMILYHINVYFQQMHPHILHISTGTSLSLRVVAAVHYTPNTTLHSAADPLPSQNAHHAPRPPSIATKQTSHQGIKRAAKAHTHQH
jgi:hypothetical protein